MPLFLFTWEEELLLQQELIKRKKSFLEKYGAYWLFDFANDALDKVHIQTSLQSSGMFSEKKLVILRGIPTDSTAHNKVASSTVEGCLLLLETFIKGWDQETIVVCVSYKPDKRTKAYKRFANNAQVKEFPLMDETQKIAYIQQKLWSLLTPKQQTSVVITCGSSFWTLQNECEKLYQYATYHSIHVFTDEQVHDIICGIGVSNNFALLDHLYTDQEKSLELITLAQTAWEDTFQFLGMLYRWVKTTINIDNLREQGISDSKTICSILKAHPFVVAKQLKILSHIQAKKHVIYGFYNDLILLDKQIKTWVIPAEWFWIYIKQAILKLHDGETIKK